MKHKRQNRLLCLITALQSGCSRNTAALARLCQTTRRTVFRDLEVLRSAGLPIQYDAAAEGYRLGGPCFLPPTAFTAEEALALISLCQELGDHGRLPFYGPAAAAAIKLESALPARLREHLRQVADAVDIRLDPRNPLPEHGGTYEALLNALRTRHCVRIAYDSFAEGQVISTRLSPYRLLFSRRSWYVIGRSSLHRQARTFNLSRIVQLETLEDTYAQPRFNLDRYLRNAWHLIPEPGPDQEVVVRFQPLVARNVAEVAWHKTQRTHFNADGTLDFRVKVSGLEEIAWWILGYGAEAEVLRPSALREKIIWHAQRMLRLYGAAGQTG